MSGLPLIYGRNTRRLGRMPVLECENVFAEPAPANQDKGLVLIGRPGLGPAIMVGAGPIRGVFYQAGLFDNDRFVVSGNTLYRINGSGVVTAVTGTIPGLERVSIAGGLTSEALSEMRIANGEGMYVYNGAIVTSEVFPAGAGSNSVDYLRGCWFAVRTDTQEIYFRFIDDAAWKALAFLSSEYKPDKAVCFSHLGDQAVVFGEASVELFAFTGDTTNPLTPYGASLLNEIGCRSRDSVTRIQDALYFVGDDCQVYRMTPAPEPISDPGMTEILRGTSSNTLIGWGYHLDGHEVYVLASEAGSFAFDAKTSLMAKVSTYNETTWLPWFGVQIGERVMCANGIGVGMVWYLAPDNQKDDGLPIVRRFTAWLEIPEGRLEVSNIVLNCAVGWSPQTGQGSTPLIKARAYRDGNVPGPWRDAGLGALGAYGTTVRWNRWGQFTAPGVLFEFEVSEPVVVRVNGVRANVQ